MPENREFIPEPTGQEPSTLAVTFVPDHELIRLIGRGSYGEVWLARNSLGSYRAVKLVFERNFRHRRPFEREFNGVKKFEPLSRLHDGLMDVLQVGRNDEAGYFYCVMELADDGVTGQAIDPGKYTPRTLAHDLSRRKRLPVEECRRIGVGIMSALGFLHSRGLIHRDVKPSNIVFVGGTPKLADIGLVAETTEARSYVGTEGFIPPEGPGTAQADIFSFGKVLYEISTGKDRHDYPELPTAVGDPAEETDLLGLNQIILRACRADPAQRYKSAAEMAEDLQTLVRGGELPAHGPGGRHLRRMTRVSGALAVLGTLAGILALANHSSLPGKAPNRAPVPLPPPPGLVSWWRGQNDATDVVGKNDGVPVTDAKFAPGKVGNCFVFDGPGRAVRLGNPLGLRLQNFTIESWIRRFSPTQVSDRPGREAELLAYGLGGYGFGLNQSGHLQLARVGLNSVTCDASITDTNWHHVALSKSGTAVKFYVDGRDSPAPEYDSVFSFGSDLALGARGDSPTNNFYGAIDELAVYDRALTKAEIRAISDASNAGKRLPQLPREPVFPAGLVGCWRGEGDASDVLGRINGALSGTMGFVPGVAGQCFNSDGKGDAVRLGNPLSLRLQNFTIESWIQRSSPKNVCGNQGYDASFLAYGFGGYSFGLDCTGHPVLTRIGIGPNAVTAARTVTDTNWHHMAVTKSGTRVVFYVDGVDYPAPAYDAAFTFNSEVSLGARGDTLANGFYGKIDELSIYDCALSKPEIQAIHAVGSKGKSFHAPGLVARDGLASWWPAEGDSRDGFAGNDGREHGDLKYVAGVVGRAFSFDGAGSYVEVPDAPALHPTNAITVECWINRRAAVGQYDCVVIKPGLPSEPLAGYTLAFLGDEIGFGVCRGTSVSSCTAPIECGKWYHVAGVYDGARVLCYVNGAAVGNPIDAPRGMAATGLPLAIGWNSGIPDRYYNGLVDELCIYDRALAAAEIRAIYEAGRSRELQLTKRAGDR